MKKIAGIIYDDKLEDVNCVNEMKISYKTTLSTKSNKEGKKPSNNQGPDTMKEQSPVNNNKHNTRQSSSLSTKNLNVNSKNLDHDDVLDDNNITGTNT